MCPRPHGGACGPRAYLDQAAAEQHLHDLLEDGQHAAVVHAQASVQELRHVQHLWGTEAVTGGGRAAPRPHPSPSPPSMPGAAGGQSRGGERGSAAGRGESHSSLNLW